MFIRNLTHLSDNVYSHAGVGGGVEEVPVRDDQRVRQFDRQLIDHKHRSEAQKIVLRLLDDLLQKRFVCYCVC